MQKPLGPQAIKHLETCGYSAQKIAKLSGDTRLFHDMNLFGDNIADEFQLMQKEFGVDFNTFHFSKYFPSEVGYDWEHFVLLFLRGTRWAKKAKDKYPPITLDMIEQTISQKKWTFD